MPILCDPKPPLWWIFHSAVAFFMHVYFESCLFAQLLFSSTLLHCYSLFFAICCWYLSKLCFTFANRFLFTFCFLAKHCIALLCYTSPTLFKSAFVGLICTTLICSTTTLLCTTSNTEWVASAWREMWSYFLLPRSRIIWHLATESDCELSIWRVGLQSLKNLISLPKNLAKLDFLQPRSNCPTLCHSFRLIPSKYAAKIRCVLHLSTLSDSDTSVVRSLDTQNLSQCQIDNSTFSDW